MVRGITQTMAPVAAKAVVSFFLRWIAESHVGMVLVFLDLMASKQESVLDNRCTGSMCCGVC